MITVWLGILFGIFYAILGLHRRLHEMWAMLFNLAVSIYFSVMFTPTLLEMAPAIGNSGYAYAACVAGLAIVAFAVLHSITTKYLFSSTHVSFPRIADKPISVVLGFVAGFILINFICFIFCITPLSNTYAVKDWCDNQKAARCSAGTVFKVCKVVGIASSQKNVKIAGDVVDWLISPEYGQPQNTPASPDTNLPAAEPNQSEETDSGSPER
jgi:hypothetical protein